MASSDGGRPETSGHAPAGSEKKKAAAESGGGEARRAAGEESARERLKRHRTEMAGRVRVPEMWGQERLLKDWVDCAVFDRPLVPAGLLTARRALVAECARRHGSGSPSGCKTAGPECAFLI